MLISEIELKDYKDRKLKKLPFKSYYIFNKSVDSVKSVAKKFIFANYDQWSIKKFRRKSVCAEEVSLTLLLNYNK